MESADSPVISTVYGHLPCKLLFPPFFLNMCVPLKFPNKSLLQFHIPLTKRHLHIAITGVIIMFFIKQLTELTG